MKKLDPFHIGRGATTQEQAAASADTDLGVVVDRIRVGKHIAAAQAVIDQQERKAALLDSHYAKPKTAIEVLASEVETAAKDATHILKVHHQPFGNRPKWGKR